MVVVLEEVGGWLVFITHTQWEYEWIGSEFSFCCSWDKMNSHIYGQI